MNPAEFKHLLDLAAASSRRAHCPYSHYHVGAALRAADGRLFAGCNVENASYGLTICAERNAVFHAIAEDARAFTAAAIVADGPAMPFPCGACRQVLAEFCPPDMPVIVAVRNNLAAARVLTLGELLPHTFKL